MAYQDEKSLLRGSGPLRRLKWLLKVIFNIVAPFLLFWACYHMTVGWWHHYWSILTWAVIIASWGFVVVTTIAYRSSARSGKVMDALWGLFLTLSLALSIVAGTMIGNRQYETYWHRFYDFQALESYVNINTMADVGGAFEDGGQFYFKEGSHVDTTRVVAFKNYDIYCVAPIIRKELEGGEGAEQGKAADGPAPLELPPSGTIDWFAVGVNCCKPDGEEWTCSGGNARNGLRVLEADRRPFYNMASTAWSLKYELPSKNPIFVEFIVDPLGKVGGLSVAGGLMYTQTVQTFFAFDVCIVLLVVIFLETQK